MDYFLLQSLTYRTSTVGKLESVFLRTDFLITELTLDVMESQRHEHAMSLQTSPKVLLNGTIYFTKNGTATPLSFSQTF